MLGGGTPSRLRSPVNTDCARRRCCACPATNPTRKKDETPYVSAHKRGNGANANTYIAHPGGFARPLIKMYTL